MPTKTEAIKRFLESQALPNLAKHYAPEMECQVNVAQDNGERIEGAFKGRKWHGWTDGTLTWKSFRIPFKASTEPEYTDSEIKFPLEDHVEAIGMTGWDWVNRQSKWVAYDFDAIVGHSEKHLAKLPEKELAAVRDAAMQIPWVTIRKSASGKGLHLYVYLNNVPTKNHAEHAALARSILGLMSAEVRFDFKSKVDICGGNMWIWHRKSRGTDGFQLIKKGGILQSIPKNWKDHIRVVSGKRRKNLPQDVVVADKIDEFDELAGQRPIVPLDDEHKKLIEHLKKINAMWWWDQDHHMLVTHTHYLAKCYSDLDLKGFFETESKGENLDEQNCFCFPMRKGAWSVRRYSPGCKEHTSWDQDGAGWTRTYLNRVPDFKMACRAHEGIEDPNGGFIFREAQSAINAARLLGVEIQIATSLNSRETVLKIHKSGRLQVEVQREQHDRADEMLGWLAKNQKPWTRLYAGNFSSLDEPEIGNYDDLVRHVVASEDADGEWVVKTENIWYVKSRAHIKDALASLGHQNKEITNILGSSIFKPWILVNLPFEGEYPGDRQWNRNAAQFRFAKSTREDGFQYPTWLKILQHCGQGLTESIKEHPWCKANGIVTGADYLLCWVASVFQEPFEPTPYLAFYGEQNSGKSSFHEALSILTTGGYVRAEHALTSQSGHNGELESAIICVVEEIDLQRNVSAYNRIKDWVTARQLSIRAMHRDAFLVPNKTHWIQCSNAHNYIPVFPGDTRITLCYVPPLDPLELVPKKQLLVQLEKEAPDFIGAIMSLEIPESNDRLTIPVIETRDKKIIESLNQTTLETFITEQCVCEPGWRIRLSEFWDEFETFMAADEVGHWTKRKVTKELSPKILKGRARENNQVYLGNIRWKDETKNLEIRCKTYIVTGEHLTPVYE